MWACQIGAFFMINLCLVVIATQFSETKKREIERMAVERARRRRHSRSSSTVTSRTSVQASTAGCYDELLSFLSYLARLIRRRAALLVRLYGRRWRRPAQPDSLQVYSVTRSRRGRKARRRRRTAGQMYQTGAWRRPGEAPFASPELSDIDLAASPRHRVKRTTTTGGELGATASTDFLSLRPAFSGRLLLIRMY